MRDLMRQIVRGDLAPGEQLPRELDLAAHYEISRGVVREAIRGLEERRLIQVRHGRGQEVTEPEEWDLFDAEVLAALVEADGSGKVLRDILEAQRIVEVATAATAAGAGDHEAREATASALAALIDTMAKASELAGRNEIAAARYRDALVAFHRGLVRAAGNQALDGMTDPIYRVLASAAGEPAGDDERDVEVAECRRIVTAIEVGDEAAAIAAVEAHLAAFATRVGRR